MEVVYDYNILNHCITFMQKCWYGIYHSYDFTV